MKTPALVLGLLASALATSACVSESPQRQSAGQYAATHYGSDAALTERVRSALARAPQINLASIKIASINGTVQLSGDIESHAQLVAALAIAGRVDGVATVRDFLIERPVTPTVIVGPVEVAKGAANATDLNAADTLVASVQHAR